MAPLPAQTTKTSPNPKNNIILMTDGYKFSHHKQFPVSWLPAHARAAGGLPPIIFPAEGGKAAVKVLGLKHVPRLPGDETSPYKITIVTNVATAVQEIEVAGETEQADIFYKGSEVAFEGGKKDSIVVQLSPGQCQALKLPEKFAKFKFSNVDESKLKRGSNLNDNFEGGYNVSYFTPRAYSHVFSDLTDDNVVFYGLQYFIKEYLAGEVVTENTITEADAFISRYMADVRVAGPGVDHEVGYDCTMFPQGDWASMVSGDYDATGVANPNVKGKLPIRIEALPEGTLLTPGVCCFKITNTHPRFFWLPNFLETILVQVWYPMSVATQAREFKKTIQAYSILSQRVSQMAPVFSLPGEFTVKNVAEDNLAIHIAQVFDLLDFGYRGVSSHETAGLGSSAYYTAGLEGSDTVAGSRMLLRYYNAEGNYSNVFEALHGATSIPAAEHSTITSWADVSEDADYEKYEMAEYNAFRNMIKQYMPSFAVSLVSDGFNIWNAVTRLWPSELVPADGGDSMRALLAKRLESLQLSLIRPDSGEGVETLPQLLTVLNTALKEHFQEDLAPLVPIFPADDPYAAKYDALLAKIRAKLGLDGEANPFRRFKGQQMRILQGDGVALDTVGDMLASLLANGFCANCVHFGSGGGLLQKLNRDSLAVAFKCCAMYVNGKTYPVGKDPIAGGKKSYGGNPPVMRGEDGVLRNRGDYDASGNMIKGLPMSHDEFVNGVPGDQLVKVFENGEILVEQTFKEVQSRARVTEKSLDAAVRKAVDNLALKVDFCQRMTTDEAISVRLAEAACGSKWKQAHPTHLASIKQLFPQYSATLEKLGITEEMDSTQVFNHVRTSFVCEKKQQKKIFRALGDDDPEDALEAMAGKWVITM
uniref:Nicotinamide phosphoribosyltransferase n=1 Tax=Noctiluca scintillans TaxID=2966 RepID=A0A7S1FGW2_NOCSC|mmetsp:Transcript_60477/g.160791  ORF Transcript_60477/g.160791 Transcript_60477/m.160791 type:complete len:874 (+) Transcript_60477:92-2713(+)